MLKRKSESSLNCYSKLKFWVSGFTLTLSLKMYVLKIKRNFLPVLSGSIFWYIWHREKIWAMPFGKPEATKHTYRQLFIYIF